MKKACLLIVTWVGATAYGLSETGPGTAVLENARLKIVFEKQTSPVLRELVQKPAGTNVVSADGSPLFALRFATTNENPLVVDSRQATRGTAETCPDGDGQRVRLTFEGFPSAEGVRVALDGRLAADAPYVRWTIAVDNPGRLPLRTVCFPYVRAMPTLGDPSDDVLIGPAFPGVLIENPAKNWPVKRSVSWGFPGIQSVQFCAYQDRATGVYLASMDTEGYGRSLTVEKQKGAMLLYQEYRLPEEAAARWSGPYETALGGAAGAWQDTADIYKQWAVRQSWCAKTLAQRPDIPDYWKAGPCIHTCEMRTYGTNRHCSGSYYPVLANRLRSLRERIGGPVVPMLPGWENHRRWTAGEYFPIFDQERAKPVLAQLNSEGFRPFVYLSGLYYTYRNEGRDGGDVLGWEQYADSLVIASETGMPKTNVLNEMTLPGVGGVWRRHSYVFCPAAPGTKAFFRSVIDRLHTLGIDIVQMDQTVSGGGDVCYSTEHGHPPGPGLYLGQAFRAQLADMRQYGKSLSPNFMLAHEELHEELIPYLDAFHSREHRERWWYRAVPGARGIPLFTYLYHEYAITYGGEGPHAGPSKSPTINRELAVNLVTGKTPAVSVWNNQKAMAKAHPDQIRMLRNHQGLLATEAKQYLMLGRMLHPLAFAAETVSLKIGKSPTPFIEQAVMTSSWQSPDGNVGHCFVNITDKPQRVSLSLDARGAAAWPKADIDLIRADPTTRDPLTRGAKLPHAYALELAPLEAAFIVLRPARK
jgi:hypothetical protein